MMPTAATGTVPVAASVDTRKTIAEPATPAPPFEVTSRIARSPGCSTSVSSMPTAWARKIGAAAK